MEYPKGHFRTAHTKEEVGNLVSYFTHKVSEKNLDETAFCKPFCQRVSKSCKNLKDLWADFEADTDDKRPPSVAEVQAALKDASGEKLYKSPGLDGITNWMLVWGGEAVTQVLAAIYKRVWHSGVLPTSWNLSQIKYLHKDHQSSKTEVTNYRPISLMSTTAKIFTRSWLPRLIKKIIPNLPNE